MIFGPEDETDHRCLSSAEILPDVLKRCARPAGHRDGEHQFVSAEDVIGSRLVATWGDDKRVAVVEYRRIDPE